MLGWARIRHPERRRDGFLYITPTGCVVYWSSSKLRDQVVRFEDIEAWGINSETKGGPLLGLRTKDSSVVAQMPVTTENAVERVEHLLRCFAEKAPTPRFQTFQLECSGVLRADPTIRVARQKMSVGEKTRRLVVTVLGAGIAIVGLVATPLPGPWSFPLIFAGLGILASEYDWAKDALDWVRTRWKQASGRWRARRSAG